MIVDIVIPVHGNWELTQQCLDTLPREAPIGKVIVVDDASPDDTAARLALRDDVEAVVLARNGGFAVACNAGAARSHADAVLFLNNDTIVPPGAIATMAATLASDPTIGAVAPLLLYHDGTIQCAGISFIQPTHATCLYAHLDGTIPQANRGRDDLILNGAALLVRRDVFVSVGGFDEGYLNGAEDMDLSLQIWASGYRCRFEPAARIIHLEGASRGKRPTDHGNHARLGRRWNDLVTTFPLLEWEDPPVLGLRWTIRGGIDRMVRERMLSLLKQHVGARRAIIRNGFERFVLRIVAHFDGRKFVEIGYGNTHGSVRIFTTADDVRTVDPRAHVHYWVPTRVARETLLAHGVPESAIRPFFLGARAELGPPRAALDEAVILASTQARAESPEGAAVAQALAGVPTRVITYDRATEDDLAAVRRAALVVALDDDPWLLFATEALANRAVVVAARGTLTSELPLPGALVVVDSPRHMAAALEDVRANFGEYAPRGARAAREIARRFPEVYAGRRIRELTRTTVHKIPEADIVAVTPELAAALRAAGPR
jgi:GT2 family glycosyltransferase